MSKSTPSTTLRLGWTDPAHPGQERMVTAAEITQTAAVTRAAAHLTVEIGEERSRRCVTRMIGLLEEAAAACGGDVIEVHTTNQITAPEPWSTMRGLGLELRGIRDRKIRWDIAVYAPAVGSDDSILWHPVEGDRTAISDSTGMRGVLAAARRHERDRIAAARKKAEDAAREYARSLPPPAAALQATARATCIRVRADGLAVTEIYHDIGGSATWTAGRNGYEVPADLSAMQAGHDAVYHVARP